LDASAVLLVAPHDWREMTRWLPCLRKLFSNRPWLIFGDLRLAGMCWPDLEALLCTLVAPESPPDRLRVALWVLGERHALCSPAALMELFTRAASPAINGERVYLTPKELQCGCAVSLGLSNRQIASALHLGEGTVKSHVHHLLRKVGVADREELAAYVEGVLSPLRSWETG
jgi:DNA-binding CsgD family transcriptional regulator